MNNNNDQQRQAQALDFIKNNVSQDQITIIQRNRDFQKLRDLEELIDGMNGEVRPDTKIMF